VPRLRLHLHLRLRTFPRCYTFDVTVGPLRLVVTFVTFTLRTFTRLRFDLRCCCLRWRVTALFTLRFTLRSFVDVSLLFDVVVPYTLLLLRYGRLFCYVCTFGLHVAGVYLFVGWHVYVVIPVVVVTLRCCCWLRCLLLQLHWRSFTFPRCSRTLLIVDFTAHVGCYVYVHLVVLLFDDAYVATLPTFVDLRCCYVVRYVVTPIWFIPVCPLLLLLWPCCWFCCWLLRLHYGFRCVTFARYLICWRYSRCCLVGCFPVWLGTLRFVTHVYVVFTTLFVDFVWTVVVVCSRCVRSLRSDAVCVTLPFYPTFVRYSHTLPFARFTFVTLDLVTFTLPCCCLPHDVVVHDVLFDSRYDTVDVWRCLCCCIPFVVVVTRFDLFGCYCCGLLWYWRYLRCYTFTLPLLPLPTLLTDVLIVGCDSIRRSCPTLLPCYVVVRCWRLVIRFDFTLLPLFDLFTHVWLHVNVVILLLRTLLRYVTRCWLLLRCTHFGWFPVYVHCSFLLPLLTR